MPSRQRRLDPKYFSSSQTQRSVSASTSRRAQASSQSQRQSQTLNPRATQRATQDDDEDDENDSAGSEGMAAIRLTASPEKERPSAEPAAEQDVIELLSEEEREEEKEAGGRTDGGGEAPSEPELESVNDGEVIIAPVEEGDEFDGIEEAETPDATTRPTRLNGSGSSPKMIVKSNAPSALTLLRKRVPVSISSSAALSPVPIPTTFTRLQAVAEDLDERLSSPGPSRGKLVVEVDQLTDEQRSRYTIWRDPGSRELHHQTTAVDNLQAFLDAEDRQDIVPLPPVQEIFEISDDDEPEETAPRLPKPKARSNFSIELPVRRPKLPTNGARKRATEQVSRDGRVQPTSTGVISGSSSKGTKVRKATVQDDDEDEDLSDEPRRLSKKDKGKGRARPQSRSASEESDRPLTRTPKHDKKRPKHSSPQRSAKKRADRPPSQSQKELLDELEMDESRRFKTKSRLRKKGETVFQRNLRKLKAKKQGVIEPDTEEESTEEDEDDDTSDSAEDSRESVGSFIEDDGGLVAEDMMPAEFSLNSTQTPEWNFKVVFHYFIMLVMQGPEVLPLKGSHKTYFVPQLEVLRRRVQDVRNSRVRSQIWPRNYVNALESFPRYQVVNIDPPEEHCLACNRRNYKSRFRLRLGGEKYDPQTFIPLENSKKRKAKEARKKEKKAKRKAKAKAKEKKQKEWRERHRQSSETPSGSEFAASSGSESDTDSDSESDSEADSNEEVILKRGEDILLGTHCNKRSQLYHQLHHWEFNLWNRVQSLYHDILRAKREEIHDDSDASPSEGESDLDDEEIATRHEKRQFRRDRTRARVNILRSKKLPKNAHNVDEITAWMDKEDYFLSEFKYLEDLQDQSRRLELDRNKDE